mgnify:CR=1 FL=1|jgi:hypothetical protein
MNKKEQASDNPQTGNSSLGDVSDSNLKSLIDQYFEENLIAKFSDNDGEFVKEIIRDFINNYYL